MAKEHNRKSGLTGKELIYKAMKHEPLPAVPWVPFAGIHAGRLKGYSSQEVLTDGNKLFESLLEVNDLYDPDGQPVMFDLQIEAEILGCEMIWGEKAPPSVVTHPLSGALEVPETLPEKNNGRLPMVLDVMRRMKSSVGDDTALFGLVTGPFTLASHLRGTDIFLDVIDHPDFVSRLLAYCTKVACRTALFYIESGMDVIGVVDPVVSQVSPRTFGKLLSEPFQETFSFLRSQGVFSSFFVCGDATKNVEKMCQTGPDCISIDENIDIKAAKQITDSYNITIGGNIPLTTKMLLGTQPDNMKFTVDLIDSLTVDTAGAAPPNFILAPGCDMPYDVPPENVVGVAQAVRDMDGTRKFLENYEVRESLPDVELPDYHHLSKPLMEVFTVDSATCAACGYMAKVARTAAEQLDGRVDMVEYKIIHPENVARITKLGVTNLPSILINGELCYSSIIPGLPELVDRLKSFLK